METRMILCSRGSGYYGQHLLRGLVNQELEFLRFKSFDFPNDLQRHLDEKMKQSRFP